ILPGRDITGAVRALYPLATNTSSLDDCLQQLTTGASQPRPSHIFLIVMESYDSWAMQPPYAALHLSDRLNALAREGIQTQAFVSSGDGTMASLSAMIAGLPHTGVFANYQRSISGGIPTSTATLFKRLGYRPRFFYGGYLSWQRLGAFCREQGFE